MKKRWITIFAFLAILALMLCSTCHADNTERIKELTNEATQLQQNLTQYQQIIQNIQVRLIQVNAIIAELKKQDLEETKIKEREVCE